MVVNSLYRNTLKKEVSSEFSFDDEVLKAALKRIYSKEFHPVTDIEENTFNALWKSFNKATDEGFGQRIPSDPDYDFYQELRYNNAVFSAFKVHRMQNDMAEKLLDSNGDLKPFAQWSKEVQPIADHQVRRWLQTEYDTAVSRAHEAADWRQFEREADILPNLKWMPSTSLNPGADHQVFWGVILPMSHTFWKSHRPGDRWGCKCSLSATDESPSGDVPKGSASDKPALGLDNNPGIDGKLFSDSHPYIKEAYKGADRAVNKSMSVHFPDYAKVKVEPRHVEDYRERSKEIKKEALPLRETVLRNKGLDHDIQISKSSIKEWLNQPHEHYAHKNELLLKVKEVFQKSGYKGTVPDHKGIKGLRKSHLFETNILGDKSWIIVREYETGNFYLHSITDSKRILDFIE